MEVHIIKCQRGHLDIIRHKLVFPNDEAGNKSVRRIEDNKQKRNDQRNGVPSTYHMVRIENTRAAE